MSEAPLTEHERRLRRRLRWAAGWLLIHAGAHLPQHWRLFLHPEGPPAAQQAMVDTLRALPVRAPGAATLWDVLGALSLGYALVLAVLGTALWVLAAEAPADALRRHAWRNALLCGVAAALLLWLHPLPQLLWMFAGAAGLFLWAALTAHPMKGASALRG